MKTNISQIESEDSEREQSENEIGSAGQPETQNSKLENSPREAGTRTGKVARLPVDVRETVNRMLESGVRFNDIIKHLDQLGYPGIHDYNISRWKTGGYQDWLAFKERLACAKVRADSARDLIRDLNNSDDLCQGNEILMATQLYEALLAPPPPPGTPEFDKHAKTLLTLSRALVTQMSERTRRDRIAFEKQRHHDKMQLSEKETIQKESRQRDLKEPLSHEETVSIVHKVDQLFGIKIEPETEPETGNGKPESPLGPDIPHSEPRTPHFKGEPETRNPEHPSTGGAAPAPICANLKDSAPPQPAPENPENEIVQRPCLVGVSPCSVRVSPAPKSTNEPAPQPAGTVSPSQNEKLQVTNYKLQIAGPPPEEPSTPNEQPADETRNSQQSRVPISPLAALQNITPRKFSSQPQGTIPMFDVCGALVDWIPQSAPCPEIFDIVGFQNRRGKYICWVHPNDPYRDPANPEPNPRRSAILNANGLIIGWLTGHPDPAKPPSPTAQPINSRRFRHGLVAWIDERA